MRMDEKRDLLPSPPSPELPQVHTTAKAEHPFTLELDAHPTGTILPVGPDSTQVSKSEEPFPEGGLQAWLVVFGAWAGL